MTVVVVVGESDVTAVVAVEESDMMVVWW